MKNDRKLILFALILFIVSCNGKNESKVASTDFIQTKIDSNQIIINQRLQSAIWEVCEKMEKREKLTNSDYDCICDYLLNSTDESISEGVGSDLFHYLKGNSLNNSAFLSYLNNKETKEKVLKRLIILMSIDIAEEYPSYKAFIKDFTMFGNSVSLKNVFDECMSIN